MPLYAHVLVHAAGPDAPKFYAGDEIPEGAFSQEDIDALLEGGAISEEPYDPANDNPGPPQTVQIEGVTYIQATDGAATGEETS